MEIVVNGQPSEVPEGTTVEDLLRSLDLPENRVAVERNGEIVPRSNHAATVLRPGDRLEVLQFVGGG